MGSVFFFRRFSPGAAAGIPPFHSFPPGAGAPENFRPFFFRASKKAARRRFPLCRFYQDRNMSHRVFAKKSTSTARMIFFTEPAPFRWKYRAPR